MASLKSPKDDSQIMQLNTKKKEVDACWNLQTRFVEKLNLTDVASYFETISLDPDVQLPNINKAVISKMVGCDYLERLSLKGEEEWGLVVGIRLPDPQDEWDLPDHVWFCLFLTWQGETKAEEEEEDVAETKTEEEEDEE